MLNQEQIIKKLHDQAQKFKRACGRKEYEKAKWYYQQAYWTAHFIELDQES